MLFGSPTSCRGRGVQRHSEKRTSSSSTSSSPSWIEAKRRDRAGEIEEIVGYHLEQAYRSLAELGLSNERIESLARRAAAPLASAGRRAFARGDMPAAVNVLSRAVSLGPRDDPARLELLPELALRYSRPATLGEHGK